MSDRVKRLITFLIEKEKDRRILLASIGHLVTNRVRGTAKLIPYLESMGFHVEGEIKRKGKLAHRVPPRQL